MSKFYYDTDDLGYEIESVGTSPSTSLRVNGSKGPALSDPELVEGESKGEGSNSASTQFGEAEEKKIVWECQELPRVTSAASCPAGSAQGMGPLSNQCIKDGRAVAVIDSNPAPAARGAQGDQPARAPVPRTPTPPVANTQLNEQQTSAVVVGTRLAPGTHPHGLSAAPAGKVYVRVPESGDVPQGVTRVNGNNQWGLADAPAPAPRRTSNTTHSPTSPIPEARRYNLYDYYIDLITGPR